jgi:predicted Zn-dependent protease
MKPFFACIASLVLCLACVTVPGSGRSRLVPLLSLNEQISLGTQAYDEELSKQKLIKSGPQYDMLQRIGTRIARSELLVKLFPKQVAAFQWEFVLIDDPKTANAWALPGGKCAVYTGLLPITQNEDALAVVLGHEITHAVAEHGAERMTTSTLIDLGLQLANEPLARMEPAQRDLVMAGLGVGAQVGVLLPFSRTHELEADKLGLFFAADAGFDPRAAIPLWQRMDQQAGSKPPEFLSTHPNPGNRIKQLEAIMPEALGYYEKSKERTAP